MGCRGIRRHYLNPEERLPLRIWHHQGAKRDVGNSNVPTGGNADGRIGIIQVEHARGQFIQSECEKILTSLGLRVPHRCQTTCCIAATLEQWLCQNTMCLIKPQLPRQDRLIDTGWCTKSSDVNTSCWSTEWCDKHVDVHVSPVSSEVQRWEGLKQKTDVESWFWEHRRTSDEPCAGPLHKNAFKCFHSKNTEKKHVANKSTSSLFFF